MIPETSTIKKNKQGIHWLYVATYLFIFFCFSGVPFGANATNIFFPTGEAKQTLANYLEYLDDPSEKLTINQIAGEKSGDFKPLTTAKTLGYDFNGKVLWVRFAVDLSKYRAQYWYLTYDYQHVENMIIYQPDGNGFKQTELDASLPLEGRAFDIKQYLFQLPTPKVSPTIYYARFVPLDRFFKVDFSWAGFKGTVESIHDDEWAYGLLYGGLMVMWLYNFALYVSLRDRAYLYYIYYLGCFTVTFFYINGFAPLIIKLNPVLEQLFAAFGYLAIHGMILFARHFLTLKTSIRWMDRYLTCFQWILLIGAFATFFQPVGTPYKYLNYLILLTLPIIIASGVIRWHQGYRPARVYTLGWAVFACALGSLSLQSSGILPLSFIKYDTVVLASVWEAVIFSIALAYRIKLIDKATTAAKNTFLAMISHELHTPLQSIVSSIDLLSVRDAANGKNAEVWRRLQVATEYLEMQMKDLTDYARLGSGKMHLHKTSFNASAIIGEFIEGLRPMAQQKGLTYEVEIEDANLIVSSDALRIQQVVNNLIANAIKYTEVGYVKIRFRYVENKSLWLVIRIEDSGIGIAPEKIKKMFEPFTQADETCTRKHAGFGMGLAIVQQLIKLLHGTMEIDSTLAKGTTLEVRIPVEKVKDAPAAAADRNEFDKKRILLVDDTEDVRISLKEIVEQLGYTCDVAATGRSAVDKAKAHRYAAIMLDISMPDMDGFSVAREISIEKSNARTPILWISATAPRLSSPEQRKLFTHFLEKPIRSDKLNTILKEILA
jgi:signal transduction histidine kinase/CheY-like chemotaxis protein